MRRLFTKFVLAPVSVTSVSLLYFLRYPRPPNHGPIDSDDEMFLQSREDHLAHLPTKTLFRGLFVHSFCTHPRLVDLGIDLIKAQQRPNPIFDSLLRNTFFAQFCAGESREEAVSLGAQLIASGIIPLLGYSKEVTNTAADIQHTELETIRCIEAASSLKKPVFVAIKLSGLSFEDEMRRLEQEVHNLVLTRPPRSVFLALAREILSHYPDLMGRLQRISSAAETLDVNLVVDAEIRFQGQVDSLPTSAILCWSLNSSKAHVWNTHQMIFRDSLPMLQQWCGNNSIKLVRGAYFNREPPEMVAASKAEVDATYDSAVEEVLTTRPNSLIIATHNHATVVKAFRLLQQNQATLSNKRQICFAQLYGMGDDITYGLVRELGRSTLTFSPNVSIVKYIPYGGLRDVMPYLVRRAEENRDMLRGSMLEREAYFTEIRKRMLSLLGLGLNRD